jgi:hypothetical protein
MCENPHKAATARFSGLPGRVLNKVIHRRAGQQQLFSRIQNLAQKVKFYFNFTVFAAASRCLARVGAPRLPLPIVILNPI